MGDEIEPGAARAPLKVRLLDIRDAARDKRDRAAAAKPRQKGAFKLPPQSLLDLPPAEHAQVDEGQLERSARVLEQKLADFGVEGRWSKCNRVRSSRCTNSSPAPESR